MQLFASLFGSDGRFVVQKSNPEARFAKAESLLLLGFVTLQVPDVEAAGKVNSFLFGINGCAIKLRSSQSFLCNSSKELSVPFQLVLCIMCSGNFKHPT